MVVAIYQTFRDFNFLILTKICVKLIQQFAFLIFSNGII